MSGKRAPAPRPNERESSAAREKLARSEAATGRGRTEPVRVSTLGEEARLIERAMLALGAGDHTLAGSFLEEHARRFPGGALERERERALERLRQASARP
jgi:hypothetical protein